MNVSYRDYEDKLARINQLTRENKCLKDRLDRVKFERDSITNCLTAVVELVADKVENQALHEETRVLVQQTRAQLGQAEIT